MRTETIVLYNPINDDLVEKEFVLYKRDEFIEMLKANNVDLSEYELEAQTPFIIKCSSENLQKFGGDEEFFICKFKSDFEELKIIYRYNSEVI